MNLDLSIPGDLLKALLPELALTGWGLVVLLVVAWRHRTPADLRLAATLTMAGLGLTAIAVWWLWWNRAHVAGLASPMIAVDDFRFVTDWLFLGAAALTVLLSQPYLEREQLKAPDSEKEKEKDKPPASGPAEKSKPKGNTTKLPDGG